MNFFDVPYQYPSRSVVVDGYRMGYVDVNPDASDAVVFLHDVAGDLDDFGSVYAAASQDRRAIGVDLVGFGKSDKPPLDDPIGLYVTLLEGLLDALEVDRAAIVGHGLGATVAAAFALARPVRVERLVLSAPFGLRERDAEARSALMRRFDFDVVSRLDDSDRRAWYEAAVARWSDRLDAVVAKGNALADCVYHRQWARAVEAAATAALDASIAPRLGALTVPTLVLWGSEDSVSPYGDAAGVRAAIPGSRLATIEDCGHMPALERSEAFVDAIVGFLGDAARTGGLVAVAAPPSDLEPWPAMTPALGRFARMLVETRERIASVVEGVSVEEAGRRPASGGPTIGEMILETGARIVRVQYEVLRGETLPDVLAARYVPSASVGRSVGRLVADVAAAEERLVEWLAALTDADLNRAHSTPNGPATVRRVLWDLAAEALVDAGRIAAARGALVAPEAAKASTGDLRS